MSPFDFLTFDLLLTGIAGVVILALGELIWRDRKRHGEGSRKFVHITIGSFMAAWPFYLSWGQIRLISICLIVGVLLSQYLKLFRTIHSVNRETWGELFFASIPGLLSFITNDPAIFAVAILHMSLGDGLAAIVGVRYGAHNRYTIMGHTKSIAGTILFFSVSLGLLGLYKVLTTHPVMHLLLLTALLATVLENVSRRGLDNITVPVVVAILLNLSSYSLPL